MYTSNFTNLTTEKIVKTIRENGYFALKNALEDQYVEMLLQEISFDQVLVNANDVGVVLSNQQKFLTHCLAKSKKTYDVITSSQVLDICKKYFTNKFILTNHRIYQTRGPHYMPWHTDNNLQIGSKLVGKHEMPGLLFIFYLSDVTQNAFQYVKTSQNWAYKYNNEIYLSDDFISSKYEKEVVTFQMPKGSLIICNTHGIHRAEPFKDKNYIRKTLLFQVDEIGFNEQNIGHGEKNLINTDYIDNPCKEVIEYLGFGYKRDYPAFPSTSISTMTTTEVIALQKKLFMLILKALPKKLILFLLPYQTIVTAKSMLWRIRHRQS